MLKFSEFMQHPRVAQIISRLQGVAAPDIEYIGDDTGDHFHDFIAASPQVFDHDLNQHAPIQDDDQVITQDGIVAQEVTTDSIIKTETAKAAIVSDGTADEKSNDLSGQESAQTPATQDSDTVQDSDTIQASDTVWEDALRSLPAPQRPLQRLLPMTARVGVLGLVAVAMWWTWPRNDDPSAWVDDARARSMDSLAVVNPANVAPGAGIVARAAAPTPDATAQAAMFANIVIVTPTSAQIGSSAPDPEPATTIDEPIILEASAAVTQAQEGAIVIEIPEAVPAEALMPALQSEPITAEAQTIHTEMILVPTATPSPTPQVVSALSGNSIPKVEIVPAVGIKTTPTGEADQPTPTATVAPTATPPPIGPGRLWSTFTPLPAAESDHFWLGNPFENLSSNQFASPSYQFGATAGNRYRPHHGLDFSNPSGTPVQAAVEGEVVHAGPDDPDLLGPYANFYGKAVVIRLDQQLPVAGGKLDVFVLYGHLSEVRAEVGQHVKADDIVGLVGMSGIAIGPHLHVEARLGANTYDHSVNPYLWLKPAEGNGAVAVRVLTANGRTWAGAKVSIAQFVGGRAVWGRQIETYLDTENIGPDPLWGENGAMGDVPAGSYVLIANINGESVRTDFTVNAGETTFVEIRTEQ